MENKRLIWLDNLKGFLMILVVWGHFFPPIDVKQWMYTFHIPLFFFISGYLYKQRDLSIFIKRRSNTLLKPYLIAATFSVPVGIVLSKVLNEPTGLVKIISDFIYLKGSVGWNSPIWFLVVLFFVEFTFSIMQNLSDKVVVVGTLISITLGYFIYVNGIILPFGLHIMLWMLPFYSLGFYAKKLNILERIKTKWLIVTPFLIGINFYLNKKQVVVTEYYHSILGEYWIFFINALFMIVCMLVIFNFINKPTKLIFFSKHSIFIMCTHYLFYYFYIILWKVLFNRSALEYDFINSLIKLSICLISYLVFFKFIDLLKKRKRLN